MTILRSGSTKDYADNWAAAFGEKSKPKTKAKPTAKKKSTTAKKSKSKKK